jgi:uncharacterized membrane protein YedE/YeeE
VKHKANLAAFGAGALFAVGLAVSGMTKPSKVVGFLDVGGAWDASLAFVMLGAIAVHFVAYRLIRRRRAPLLDSRFHLPTRKDIDLRLVLGAALFGIGWGLGGFCPGPALVTAAGGGQGALVFALAMTAGILVEHGIARGLAHGRTRRELQRTP